MANPLDQLYKTKLQLIAVLAVMGGVVGLALARWADRSTAPSWLSALPIGEVGSILFGTGLLAIFFEYVDRKHGDARTNQRIRDAVRREAPAIRDAVLDSFAFSPDTLQGIASDDTLDRIATNALGLRLRDPELAHDVYTDVRDQVVRAPERWRDADISISLTNWDGKPATELTSAFVAVVRCQYRVRPAGSTLRFACVSKSDEYRELLRDPTVAFAWYLDASAGIDAGSPEAFGLLQLSVDGNARKVRRAQRAGSQTYSVSIGDAVNADEVVVAYTYRALVLRHGHLLYLELPRPTKGLHVQLNYADAGIRRVNTLDFFAGSQPSRIEQAPSAVAAKTVDVSFDGWIFPRSGVAFVWVLDDETSNPPSKARGRTTH